MEKKIIFKGLRLGVIVFLAAQAFFWIYLRLTMFLVPKGASWTPFRGALTSSCNLVSFIRSPLSKILPLNSIYGASPFFYNHSAVLHLLLSLIWWLGLSIIVVYLRNRKNQKVRELRDNQ